MFDYDGDGFITPEDMVIVMKELGESVKYDAEIQDLIREADIDGDGRINFTEFFRLITSLDERP